MGLIPWVLVSGWVYFDYGGCCRVLSRRSLLSTLVRSFLLVYFLQPTRYLVDL